MDFKKIIIITGHYGSGKTNLAVNIAVEIADKGNSCTVVDLDIVNPYFRTADFKQLFAEKGIGLVAPIYANSNLDIPAMNFNLTSVLLNNDYVVIDVGGDDAGAMALGVHASYLSGRDDVEMLYVVNKYRYLTENPNETIELMHDIEKSSRIKCTGIVNNSNLGMETNSEIVKNSLKYADDISEITGLDLKLTAFNGELVLNLENSKKPFPINICVKTLWNK